MTRLSAGTQRRRGRWSAAIALIVAVAIGGTDAKAMASQDPVPPAEAAARQPGLTITGSVSMSDGAPAAIASVTMRTVGESEFTQRSTVPDVAGRFVFTDVKPGVYHVAANARGYVDSDEGEHLVRAGESVAITLRRGGVITGTVVSATGAPLVRVTVQADRVGSRRSALNLFEGDNTDSTDDRGVYRIYGLAPGEYVVSAGGGRGTGPFSPIVEGEARTYHPSSNRTGATRLTVGAGQEVTGIDIRHRGERGHRVSGTVAGAFVVQGGYGAAVVVLSRVADGSMEELAFVHQRADTAFAFDGIADGEYLVSAASGFNVGSTHWSEAKRVEVRGADVKGVHLVLEPSGSVSGQVVVEPQKREVGVSATSDAKPGPCSSAPFVTVRDLAIRVQRADLQASHTEGTPADRYEDLPTSRGSFLIKNVRPGHYMLDAALGASDLYVSALTRRAKTTAEGKPQLPLDIADGVRVGPGERLDGVEVRVSRGAGSVAGTLETGSGTLPKGPRRVYLVPLDPDRAHDSLRFHAATPDGASFSFERVAPGRYTVIALVEEPSARSGHGTEPNVDRARRDFLRRLAVSGSGKPLSVGPCQTVTGLVVQAVATAKSPGR